MPVVGALLAGAVLATTAFADSVKQTGSATSTCGFGIFNDCAIAATDPHINAVFSITPDNTTLDANLDQCYTPKADDVATNRTVLTLSAGNTLTLTTTQLCFLADPSLGGLNDPSGDVSGIVRVTSGTGTYAGATGGGSLKARYVNGSVYTGPIDLTFTEYDLTITTPPPPCDPLTDPTCKPADAGATPELGSLTLFGSALTGLIGYAALRRRRR